MIKTKRFVFNINLQRPRSWRNRAANVDEVLAWDRVQRRKYGIFSGIKLFSQTSEPGRRILISKHWPHRCCWSWSVSVARYRKGYSGNRAFIFNINRRYRCACVTLFGPRIDILWQDYAHLVRPGSHVADAPEPQWLHEREAA